MNFLLSIAKEDYGTAIIETKGFAETLGFGGQIVLIGMATVFAVLVIIMLALYAFKVVFHDIPAKKASPNVEADEAIEAAPVQTAATDDYEIIAVIAAAIAAAESESNGVKFRVVSFKKR